MDGTIHWYLPTAKRQKMVRADGQPDRQSTAMLPRRCWSQHSTAAEALLLLTPYADKLTGQVQRESARVEGNWLMWCNVCRPLERTCLLQGSLGSARGQGHAPAGESRQANPEP